MTEYKLPWADKISLAHKRNKRERLLKEIGELDTEIEELRKNVEVREVREEQEKYGK